MLRDDKGEVRGGKPYMTWKGGEHMLKLHHFEVHIRRTHLVYKLQIHRAWNEVWELKMVEVFKY